MFDRTNFMHNTQCEFVPCETPERQPDYVSDSGSEYWYEGDGVIRHADHWGRVSSCLWTLHNPEHPGMSCQIDCPCGTYPTGKATAYAPFSAFRLTRGQFLRDQVRSCRSSIAVGSELRCTYVSRDRRGKMDERTVTGIVTRVSDAFVTVQYSIGGRVVSNRLSRRLIYPANFNSQDARNAEILL